MKICKLRQGHRSHEHAPFKGSTITPKKQTQGPLLSLDTVVYSVLDPNSMTATMDKHRLLLSLYVIAIWIVGI